MEKCSIFIKNTVFLSDDSEKLFFEKKKIKNGCFFDMLLCLIENKYQDFCQIFLYAEGRMIGMKNTKRWLAILLALVITVFSVPASCLVFGTDVEVIELTTLDAFTSGTEKYTATSGVILSTINAAGVIGDGKALEVKGDSLGSWSKFSVNIPLSCSVGNAKGLLAYVKWVNNSNFFVSVGGTSDGNNVTGTLKKWNYGIPLFNAASDSWTGSAESNNEGAIFVGGNFKGYVYIPFGKLFGKEAPVTLTDLNIESFRTESVGTFTIGGVWLVNNDIIPDDFSDDLTTKVLLDNTVNTDLSKNSDGNINLKTLEDFTVNTSFNIAVDGNTVNGASVTAIDNIGSIGNGKSLAVDVNNDGSWAIAYLNIPLSVDIGTSKGLLVYAKWGSNSNMYLRLTGTGSSGDSLSATPISGWCNYPIYRVSNDRWSGTDYAGTNTSYNVGNSFEGYAYIPFERLTNTLSTLSALEIGAFRASGCSVFTIGGVWLVENESIPAIYEEGIGNKVLLDGITETSLSNKLFDADAVTAEYSAKLDSVTIDGVFYKQEDLDTLRTKLKALKTGLEKAETKTEQEALIAKFDAEFNKFMKGPQADFSFAAISDIHIRATGSNLTRFQKFLKDIKTADSDVQAVLVAGDLTENGSANEFESYWNTVKKSAPKGTVVLSALGNHDARGNFLGSDSKQTRWKLAKSLYLDGLNDYLGTSYTDTYYHKEISGYDFIVMNTEDADKDTATISETQQRWLKSRLEKISSAKPGKPIFIMLHQPLPLTHPGTTDLNSTVGASGKGIKSVIENYPQVIFLSGHIHNGIGYSDIINDGKGIYIDLPSSENNSRGNTSLTLVYYVSIYGNIVRFRVRDFQSGEWLDEHEKVTFISGVKAVNKDELRKAYYQYRFTGKGRYSEETFNAFSAALENAHTVLNDLNVSQMDINNALSMINSTLNNLTVEPLRLAADNEAMHLSILQDFADFDISGIVSGSENAAAKLQSSSKAIDSVNSLIVSSTVLSDISAKYTVSFKAGTGLAESEGLLAYIKLPTAGNGKTAVNVRLQLETENGTADMSGAVFTYLDNASQTWYEIDSSSGYYALPTGFEGYIRLSFGNMTDNQSAHVQSANALSIVCGSIGGEKTLCVGGVYAVTKDTAGLTAIIGNKAERYIENGKEPTEEHKSLFSAAMKAETLQSFRGYYVGGSALGDIAKITYQVKDDITVNYVSGANKLMPGNGLEIGAETMHSFWPGDNAVEEWAYITVKYPENILLNNMAALMFYVETPKSNPNSEDPFSAKIFFNMHTRGSDGTENWSNTSSYETLYFLKEGSTEWQRMESDTGHIYLPTDTKGYVLAPIDSFTTNPISTTLEGRKLIDTTFIISGFGGEIGSAKIGAIWSVMDYGTNNILISYNGAEVWSLSSGRAAVLSDLDIGDEFPEEEKLIGELPEATVSDYQINEIDWTDITDSSVKLSWDAYPGAASYLVRIYKTVYSNTGIKYRVVSEKTVNGTTAVMDGLEPLNWYYAVVQALDSDGDVIAVYPNALFQSADIEDYYNNAGNRDLPDTRDTTPIMPYAVSLIFMFSLTVLRHGCFLKRKGRHYEK